VDVAKETKAQVPTDGSGTQLSQDHALGAVGNSRVIEPDGPVHALPAWIAATRRAFARTDDTRP